MKLNKIKDLYLEYERVLIPATLVAGVVVDMITFQSINIGTAFSLLAVYLGIAGLVITFMNLYDHEVITWRRDLLKYIRVGSPLIIQFAFGALLSAIFIFYFFSGSLAISWPFILVVISLMVSNDIFREYYTKPTVQLGIYFFILFCYLVLVLPFLLDNLAAWVFLLGGTASLVFIWGYIHLLSKYLEKIAEKKTVLISVISCIFIVMNIFYFTNIIPPVPLSLRDSGVYHSLNRNSQGNYEVKVEEKQWYDYLIPGQTIHINENDEIYVYTAIFAPNNLTTQIVHHWHYYDEQQEQWVSADKLPFVIEGGREDGFRGFSVKSNIWSGSWRVDVETQRGQVVGRVEFELEEIQEDIKLKTKLK
jgi:hypothetical protein